MDGSPKNWYNHIPIPVTTVGPCAVLYDQQIHIDIHTSQQTGYHPEKHNAV